MHAHMMARSRCRWVCFLRDITLPSSFRAGANLSGQLGDGTSKDHPLPGLVGDATHKFIAIAAGVLHTCGLHSDGRAMCWGELGSQQFASAPRTLTASDACWTRVGFSRRASAFIPPHATCPGSNEYGTLGDGTTTNRATPTLVGDNTHTFSAIAAGREYNCGLHTDRRILCWGALTWPETAAARLRDSPTEDSSLLGHFHFAGYNASGQLGDGTYVNFYTPGENRLLPYTIVGTHKFAAVAADTTHTCGLLVDGRAMCWGSGQAAPVYVAGDNTFIAVGVGGGATFFITK